MATAAYALGVLLVLTLTTCGGCAGSITQPREAHPKGNPEPSRAEATSRPASTVVPAEVIYTAGGKLGAAEISNAAVQPGSGQRYLLIMEWRRKAQNRPGRYHLVRLDLSTGEAAEISDLGEGERESERPLAYAPNGRIAVQETRWGADTEYRLRVREPSGQWRSVTEWSPSLQEPVSWSPDSTKLLFARQLLEERWPLVYTVATGTPGGGFAETRLSGGAITSARWTPRGSLIAATPVTLSEIEWPSRRKTMLLRLPLPVFDVAEEAGVVVAATTRDGERYSVWTVRPGEDPALTSIVLQSIPMELKVSPEARQVAVVPGRWPNDEDPALPEGGLVVYDLSDGAEHRVPDTVGKNIMLLQWALGGRALIFSVAPKGAFAGTPGRMGEQLWLVRMQAQ